MALKKSERRLQARLFKSLPADLSELDKKYAREISKPMVRLAGELTKRLYRLLEKDRKKQTRKSSKAAIGLLARRFRQLVNVCDFKMVG
ncbi:hypothetical protein Q3A66_12040 [Hymenobacter sp. BT770]|uniref:hypothetical protein n=1 Tax=Hymenobacter sp. BT770 TaxID=2886942 RepID=UPI001D1083A4|nr:hypothetical protein [Hymenobacter sp. BT770]MCC3153563.1 hypothetical protein [Hymenobacter sp. BT770]MDO3415799.1 hypothetical protein [Hymenobacter sp. BT770]